MQKHTLSATLLACLIWISCSTAPATGPNVFHYKTSVMILPGPEGVEKVDQRIHESVEHLAAVLEVTARIPGSYGFYMVGIGAKSEQDLVESILLLRREFGVKNVVDVGFLLDRHLRNQSPLGKPDLDWLPLMDGEDSSPWNPVNEPASNSNRLR